MAASLARSGDSSPFVNPATGLALRTCGDELVDEAGERIPVIGGIPRFSHDSGRSLSNDRKRRLEMFGRSQGRTRERPSSPWTARFWGKGDDRELDVLEVGGGAGELSRAILDRTKANLYSIEPSSLVETNWRNNGLRSEGRLTLAQAEVDKIPFPDERFDKVLCLGVLEHTSNFESTLNAVIRKARGGGDIVVSFLPERRSWFRRKRPDARSLGEVMLMFVKGGASVGSIDFVRTESGRVAVMRGVRWLYPGGPPRAKSGVADQFASVGLTSLPSRSI